MARSAFEAVIEEGRGGGAWVRVPPEAMARLAARGRVPVRATFDGQPYRGSIAPMGSGHLLGITKAVRKVIGKGVGDTVCVAVEQDLDERTVELPWDLDVALSADPDIRDAWDRMSYTRRREAVRWVEEARRPDTRARRLADILGKLGGQG